MKDFFKNTLFVICFIAMLGCYLGLFFIGALIEWSLIRESLWQFFNPFILIFVIIQMIQMPITYILVILGLLGYWGINKLDRSKV
jgi:hypothetical protein